MPAIWAAWCMLVAMTAMVATQPNSLVEYHIEEELEPDTLIGNLEADARLGTRYDSKTLDLFRYTFLSQPEDEHVYLTLEEKTGVIRTAERIDRDQLCPGESSCALDLDVAVSPARYFQVLKLRVHISDTNDNAPRFDHSRVTWELSESSAPGLSFGLPLASDPDSSQNSIKKYELVPRSDRFLLRQSPSLDGTTDLQLVLRRRLDREKQPQYTLTVLATDGGSPPLSGSVVITVRVLDANDHKAVFNKTTVQVEVTEDTPVHSTVAVVHAFDRDQGENGRIVFSLAGRSQTSHGDLFGITADSGEVYLKRPLDFEQTKLYHLVVSAQDAGAGAQAVQATVVIRVKDVNDCKPEISVNTLTSGEQAAITEDAPVGTFVAHVSVLDRDSGRNGQVSCALDGPRFAIESMSRSQYKVVTAQRLDRETRARHFLTLRCRDHGNPALVSTRLLTAHVTDVNDCRPKWPHQVIMTRLAENNSVNAFIARLNASDPDEGPNGRVRFRLLGAKATELVKLDPVSGIMRAARTFDYELRSDRSHRFRVAAQDQGTPSLSATATVSLIITDVNDSPPVFTTHDYVFTIPENQPPKTLVGKLDTVDADDSPYDAVKYSFARTVPDTSPFILDVHTGQLRTQQALDREREPVYFLTVVARNTAPPARSALATIRIIVQDVNDHVPEIFFPEIYNDTIYMSTQVPVGYLVTRIRAFDRDIGENARLTYTLSGANAFEIERDSGAIHTREDLSDLQHRVFHLTVIVSDGNTHPKLAKTELNIVVNKSISFGEKNTASPSLLNGDNLTIVMSLGGASGLVMIVLIVIIICVKIQDRQRRRRSNRYSNQSEPQKTLHNNGNVVLRDKDDSSMGLLTHHKLDEKSGKMPQGNLVHNHLDSNHVVKKDFNYVVELDAPIINRSPVSSVPSPAHKAPSRFVDHNGDAADTPAAISGAVPDIAASFSEGHESLTDQQEGEVQKLLNILRREQDDVSTCSGDGSNADSGRGASDEGEFVHNNHHNGVAAPDDSRPGSQPSNGGTQHSFYYKFNNQNGRPANGRGGRAGGYQTLPTRGRRGGALSGGSAVLRQQANPRMVTFRGPTNMAGVMPGTLPPRSRTDLRHHVTFELPEECETNDAI